MYQYFPDKQAIFTALHTRHVEQIDRVIQSTLVEHAASLMEELLRAMIDAHTTDPELYQRRGRKSRSSLFRGLKARKGTRTKDAPSLAAGGIGSVSGRTS
jgi:AcrR family transcriptional regulator